MIKGRASKFGRLVIGKAAADQAAAEVKTKVNKFGPLVTGTKVRPGTNTPAEDSERVTAGMSVEGMEKVLRENPTFVQSFADSEFRRLVKGPGTGPRRTALQLFIELAAKGLHPDAATVLIERCTKFLETGTDEELARLQESADIAALELKKRKEEREAAEAGRLARVAGR